MTGTGSSNGDWRTIVDLSAFLDAAPDAILTVEESGAIRSANPQAGVLFGCDPADLVGRGVDELVPARFRPVHALHRGEYMAKPRPRAMGAALDLVGRRRDGTEFPIDVSLSTVTTPDHTLVLVFARDATLRRRAEQQAAQLRKAEEQRAQAFEINDNVVQGLAGALMWLEAGDLLLATRYLTRMLTSTRAWIEELLRESGAVGVAAGDLVRRAPAEVVPVADLEGHVGRPIGDAAPDAIRVLIADDAPDVRFVLRMQLDDAPDISVVGEAANGAEAIERAVGLRPDVILLDLAMPVLDGLQALPDLRRLVPEAKVVVVSGFGAAAVRSQVIQLGAAAYVEKGVARAEILAVVRRAAGREQPVRT